MRKVNLVNPITILIQIFLNFYISVFMLSSREHKNVFWSSTWNNHPPETNCFNKTTDPTDFETPKSYEPNFQRNPQ